MLNTLGMMLELQKKCAKNDSKINEGFIDGQNVNHEHIKASGDDSFPVWSAAPSSNTTVSIVSHEIASLKIAYNSFEKKNIGLRDYSGAFSKKIKPLHGIELFSTEQQAFC